MTLEPKVKNETSADHPSTSLSSHSTFSPLLLYISLLLAPSLCISVATARGPRRSSGGRIPTGRSACPRTSSRRSDWSGWWRRPRGSPALRRSRAQSHTAPCSSAVPGLKTTSKQSRDEEDGRIFEKVKGHRLSVPGKASHIKHQYNIRKLCSRDVLNRLKHKELPLTAAFQDQILSVTSLRSAAARRLHAQTNWAFSLPHNFLIVSGSTRRLLGRLEMGKDLVSHSLVFICLQEQQHKL